MVSLELEKISNKLSIKREEKGEREKSEREHLNNEKAT